MPARRRCLKAFGERIASRVPTARPPKSTSASFAGSLEPMAFARSVMHRFNAFGTAEIQRVA